VRMRHSEKDIKKSEERLRSLIEMAPDGIITSTLGGEITSINNAYEKLTGYTKEEVVGVNFTKLPLLQVNMKDFPQWLKMLGLVALGKNPPPLEFQYIHKDGRLMWGSANFTLVRATGQKSEMLGILRDITDRKQDEEKIKKLLEELERSNRELDDYTYAVSHDLKAPLRTIESFSSFLLEDHSDNLDDLGKDYLNRIQLATNRMNILIQDLLLISRVGRLNTELDLVDLNEVISDIKDDIEITLYEKNGEIIYTKLPSIKTQKVWIKQVFSNLINNGLKFNESSNPRIWINCEERKDHYIFSVKDNGIGIDEKHHEKIFRIFQRLHTVNEYPGTGAGLTMCKKIVESMGGNISLDSKLGKGSTFYITIPKGSMISEESEPPYQSDDALSVVHENTNNEH